ncbi:GGDEF domain-containing protein [Deinococcus cellulosilyticus]|uniref:GGDEF domain-containing protein n=1 Tax=Deinococcus cellulosilyticus (strain DSM 18568 / NBRC 106333 / KACC 11606 / 5516J-15) TaxID=1223518 RepID=A0A511N632_DEIC1|nr:GGDEF domain-containing protein [Deinococcus cellulosilyticus]GEM48294.1 hypothetical protein DC3_39290 [Deinococcus cellulosilyticus NBRC 106333 = KACC 11606]
MQNPSETTIRFAQACIDLQGNSIREVLAAMEAALSALFPGSQFRRDEETLLPVGWLSPVEFRGYISVPPSPLSYRVRLENPLNETEKTLLDAFLNQFERAVKLVAFQEELDRQARRDWLTGLPHRFQLYRQLDAYGRLLSSYHVGLLEVSRMSPEETSHQAFNDLLVLQVVRILSQRTLHVYRLEAERFVFILDHQQKEELIHHLAELPELKARLSWADTREGSPERIVDALISRMQMA